MAARLDPTFHATPKLAMEAPPETYGYALMLSPDFSQPDGLDVIDVRSRPVRSATSPLCTRPTARSWTSIATGKRPTKHGITGFIEPTLAPVDHLPFEERVRRYNRSAQFEGAAEHARRGDSLRPRVDRALRTNWVFREIRQSAPLQ